MMADQESIKIENLDKSFGKVPALQKINLTVDGGQIIGLLGPNGAGKTTLIRLLIGATHPSAGTLSVLGLHPGRQKQALRQQIGYMPQLPALYDDLSARDNLRFFGRAHQASNLSRRIDEVLDFVGLSQRSQDPIYKFSGGMKQRVSLACALVNQPRMLFLDEPTSGIDPELREGFWTHFRQLTRSGVTIIVSTHQMDEALYCDRLAILHRGNLLANETPGELMGNSQSTIRIWRASGVEEERVSNYPEALAALLQQHGLDPQIKRIEIEGERLEAVILRLIHAQRRELAPGGER